MNRPPNEATVLVVDDSAAKRYLLVSWLTRAGFTVTAANSGAAALELVDRGGVDLVVLDVRLGDMTGFEVCEQIKAQPRHAALPVIHVSAHAVDVADKAQGLARGADAYLVEPIDPDELVATAQAVLRYYRARQRAELLAGRLTRLVEATLEVNSTATLEQLLEAAARGAAAIFGAPAVVLADNVDGVRLAGATAGPQAPVTLQPWPVDPGQVPVGVTTRSDPATFWPPIGTAAAPATGQGTASVAVAAVRLRPDRPAVEVAVPEPALITGPDVLSQLAQAVATAVEAQRSYDEEHRLAITLQRSLLPQRLPQIPGLDLAVRYEPASVVAEIGGDFYELAMIDGRLLAAIGDVAGHSLHAATVMAELRHAVRAYAVAGQPPGALLDSVNNLMHTLLPGELATICLLSYEPATGHIRLASAGHPPSLLLAGGRAEFIWHLSPLLGVAATRPVDHEFTLPRGGTLVLYTDGLIERRDQDIDEGMRMLAEAAGTVDGDLDLFCARLLAELASPEIMDDIAVLALRRH